MNNLSQTYFTLFYFTCDQMQELESVKVKFPHDNSKLFISDNHKSKQSNRLLWSCLIIDTHARQKYVHKY